MINTSLLSSPNNDYLAYAAAWNCYNSESTDTSTVHWLSNSL